MSAFHIFLFLIKNINCYIFYSILEFFFTGYLNEGAGNFILFKFYESTDKTLQFSSLIISRTPTATQEVSFPVKFKYKDCQQMSFTRVIYFKAN